MAKSTDRKGRSWMRAQKAAKLLGVTRPTILAMVAREELHSQMVDDLVFVWRRDVEARLAQQQAEQEAASSAA